MGAYERKYAWMPPASEVSSRIQKRLLPFTPGRWGWTIWYQGKTRMVCGIKVPLEQVPECWTKLKGQIDSATTKPRKIVRTTLREALSEYFTWLDHRVKTGLPKPLAAISAEDYKRNLMAFARFAWQGRKLADAPLHEFSPEHFKGFAEHLASRSPTSFARVVATVSGFFNYCKDEGLIADLPNFGRYFVRPPQSQIRDRRMEQKKAWDTGDLWKIVEHADTQERAWIGLALSGAMDNADVANLTFDLFDESGMFLDYRRRKTGRTSRIIPLHPMAREWLDAYFPARPAPADPAFKELVFLTPTGLPLQRTLASESGVGNHVDYLAHCWDRLLRRAALRRKPAFKRVCVICGKPRQKPRAVCCGQTQWKKKLSMAAKGGADFKGFRSLRTTFANLTPRGFSDERKLIMGHSGDITIEHYVEKFGTEHLQKLVELVWLAAFTCPWPKTAPQGKSNSRDLPSI